MRNPKRIHMHNNSGSSSNSSIHIYCSALLLEQYFVDKENNRNFQQNFSLLCNPNKRHTHTRTHTLFDKVYVSVLFVWFSRGRWGFDCAVLCWHCLKP